MRTDSTWAGLLDVCGDTGLPSARLLSPPAPSDSPHVTTKTVPVVSALQDMTAGKDLPYVTSLLPSPPHSPPGGSPKDFNNSVVGPHTPASTPDASMSLGTTNNTTRRTRSSDTSWISRSSVEGVASRRGVPRLEDFELIRVVGKGCAGRVG